MAEASIEQMTNLASDRFKTKVLFASDEWFACASNLFKSQDPVFIPEKFTEYGKWMDGWETRRKRIAGHDFCIVQLGLPGTITAVEIDTAFFTGNNAPRFSLQAEYLEEKNEINSLKLQQPPGTMGTCATPEDLKVIQAFNTEKWPVIIPFTYLKAGYPESRLHRFYLKNQEGQRWTHLRLNIYPDGGVARLRVYGLVSRKWDMISANELIDLAAATNGGVAIACSDKHYGEPKNLIGPGRALNMGDGWETARKSNRPAVLTLADDGLLQVPGSDWAIIKLGIAGQIDQVEVDTFHFKGNFPESCLVEAGYYEGDDNSLKDANIDWDPIVPRTKLSAHKQHYFAVDPAQKDKLFNCVKLTMYPDGGISRLRIMGYKSSKRSRI